MCDAKESQICATVPENHSGDPKQHVYMQHVYILHVYIRLEHFKMHTPVSFSSSVVCSLTTLLRSFLKNNVWIVIELGMYEA